jgi:hypothetical protein
MIELIGEQVAVKVEGHARRCVPEHLLYDLHSAPGRDGQRHSFMP